jgi:Trk-type K+ transport system membrane component
VVRDDTKALHWADDTVQAAQVIQMRAEGQELQRRKTSRSPWMIVVYVFAVLFGFLLLMMLVSFGISLVMNAGF